MNPRAAPRLIFLHGPVASGKLTIARELAARTGWALFHNHLTVDLLLAVFPFGSPAFARLRESIWLEVIGAALASGVPLIFTFAPERTVSAGFPAALARRVETAGGTLVSVAVACAEAERERRIETAGRSEHRKLNSLSAYRTLRSDGAFAYPPIPFDFQLDATNLPPAEAAARLARLLLPDPAPGGDA